MENETKNIVGRRTLSEQIGVAPILILAVSAGLSLSNCSRAVRDTFRPLQKGSVDRYKMELRNEINREGNRETLATYQGTNYLLRTGTNGIPYFQPVDEIKDWRRRR